MNRRNFLRTLGLASAAYALDPDLALWVPGRKTFFLPSCTSLTPAQIVAIYDKVIREHEARHGKNWAFSDSALLRELERKGALRHVEPTPLSVPLDYRCTA